MSKHIIECPELFFCLVAPIATDLNQVISVLSGQLSIFGYDVETIQITDILPVIDESIPDKFDSLEERYETLIKKANDLRERLDADDIMATLTFFLIQAARLRRQADRKEKERPVAYIIRQLKRPEEIARFREVYGKQVFQISAYADPELRRRRLATKMRDEDSSRTRTSEFEHSALELVNRDEHEASVSHGQRLRDVFPLADVFIDATTPESAKTTLERFLKIVFGYNFHSPSREEYGMYMAKSASLRSVDLSRQVGAAVFTDRGEVKVLGCNEVPSPKGGTYWEGDEGDTREFRGRNDTNDDFKHRLLSDVLKNLAHAGVVDKKFAAMKSRDFLASIKQETGIELDRRLMMMDIIEYGRIIHAEMNAITDAARKGISLNDSTLYCTTFPCHLCAKHIISSGIKRVIYIEPYPKSYVSELYRDDIALGRFDKKAPGKVYFEPFIGVAPFRYRDFFEKSRRKDGAGNVVDWQYGEPKPLIRVTGTEYIQTETDYLKLLIQQFAEAKIMLPESILQNHAESRDAERQPADARSGTSYP